MKWILTHRYSVLDLLWLLPVARLSAHHRPLAALVVMIVGVLIVAVIETFANARGRSA